MEFIAGKCGAAERLAAVNICIDNAILMLAASTDPNSPETSAGFNISEYQLDDSMVKIKTSYRSTKDISESIFALQKMAEMYKNQLRGRQMILKDIRTFR
jgi:conjugal transfer/entry exclusion protein